MGAAVALIVLAQACAVVLSFNIRVDLLLIYPYLALLTLSAIAYFARRSVRSAE